MSTLYHSLNVFNNANKTLEQVDHAMIYLLIAGTYTPLCLVVLCGGWLVVITWMPLTNALSHGGIFWLVLGVFYTVPREGSK